jgi:NADPH:quinone reductase-like Zn-dependent oxidoreductase
LVWFGVASAKKDGVRVIPITLLTVSLLKILPDGKKLLMTPDLGKDNEWFQATLAKLLDLLAAGEINPIVSDRVPLVESARAHELLESGRYAGRIVLVTDAYATV